MDLGTTITALVIVLICIAPFVVMSRSNKKREKRFLQSLSELAKKSNSTILQHDIWLNAAIGIDEATNMIFFTKKVTDIETAQQVALAEIQKCRVINTSKTVNNNGSNFKAIDKLELAFNYHDKNKAETLFEFYDANAVGSTLSGELQLVDKWCKIANDKIGTFAQKK
ncbi:MAG: hypothetical protein RL708_232 [Bacteroidota bacterium]